MPHLRIFRHYIRTPYLIVAFLEAGLVFAAMQLAVWLRFEEGAQPTVNVHLTALVYAVIVIVAMGSMGVYEARLRDGFAGMVLRSAIAIFLLASMGAAIVFYFVPELSVSRGVVAWSATLSFAVLILARWIAMWLVDEDLFKRRVLVLGTGRRAAKVASRMRRRYDRRSFKLLGYARLDRTDDLVSRYGGQVLEMNGNLVDYCERHNVHEIVVALDERRRNTEAGAGLPLEELMDCRLRGIQVTEIQAFIEREAGKVDTELLRPSWMVFSDGFVHHFWRRASKRTFDLVASIGLLLIAWPFMLLTALAIWIEGGLRGPVLYRQQRIGLEGEPFSLIKFRSMCVDAESDGHVVWAECNDPRVTWVGAVIRKIRFDELPQLFNVLRGDMSFVGPRPERPYFVDALEQKLPYYDYRHNLKPGITGWAQLSFPYGASFEDAGEKLEYDLYYLKNHSILLDLTILMQTVGVVLLGQGAR